jgi:hypothetical protein
MTAVFGDVALCNVVQVYRRFRHACCLHRQGYISHTALREIQLPPPPQSFLRKSMGRVQNTMGGVIFFLSCSHLYSSDLSVLHLQRRGILACSDSQLHVVRCPQQQNKADGQANTYELATARVYQTRIPCEVQTAWTCSCHFRNLRTIVAMQTFGNHEGTEKHLGALYRTQWWCRGKMKWSYRCS